MSCIKKFLSLVSLVMFSLIFSQDEVGSATWYGRQHHGRKSADGSVFDKNALTAAAPKRYSLGTILRVTNLENNLSTVVKVTDRGGFERRGHLIDLSESAFRQIASIRKGVVKVRIEVIK